ncbi:MAG: cyclic nucleotide-binding domain-containing protein [Idiomarina sp.]|nr:cyclic nucleotide-binding domain-containing protein [Idiomarina sp.]
MGIKVISKLTELRAVELLSRAPLFKALSSEDKRMFAMMPGLFRMVSSGTRFIEDGEADYCIYVLMSGKAKVTKEELLLGYVEAGDFVGEVAFVTREARTASVTALTDLVVMRIDAENFRKLPIRAREIVKDQIINGLEVRIARMNKEIMQFRKEAQANQDTPLVESDDSGSAPSDAD